jgi:hypothetical protein
MSISLLARTGALSVNKTRSATNSGRRLFRAWLEYVGVGRSKRDGRVKRNVASQAVELRKIVKNNSVELKRCKRLLFPEFREFPRKIRVFLT